MSATFTKRDNKFLRAVGISAEPMPTDGTMRILERLGIPVTRENYLMLAFAGHPPQELDGELEEEIERVFRENSPEEEDS